MATRGRLYFTVGLPRSGKSSWCDQWVREALPPRWSSATFVWELGTLNHTCCDANGMPSTYAGCVHKNLHDREVAAGTVARNPRVVISGDDFRHAIHGRPYEHCAEGIVFASMDIAIRSLLMRGFDVIVDETATTEHTIWRYLLIDIDAVPIFIDADVEVCKQRALQSGKTYLIRPIEKMAKQLEALKAGWPANFNRLKDQVRWRYANENTSVEEAASRGQEATRGDCDQPQVAAG